MPEHVVATASCASGPTEAGEDLGARLARLRARGAAEFDAAGWRFIEALARRAAQCPQRSRAALERKLVRALEAHEARLDRDAGAGSAWAQPVSPDSPLAQLLAVVDGASTTATHDTPDLKALRHFRRSWARLHTERQFAQALTQAPENAGPLNSQHLLLQAMTRLRNLSPDYLEAFIGYAETLLWLEQAGTSLEAVRKSPAKAATTTPPSGASAKKAAPASRARKTRTRPGTES